MTKSKKIMIGALPFAALIVLFAVFCGIVSSKGYRLDMYIKIIFNEGIVLSIVATGAIFIYTLGSFDISLGAATLFSAKDLPVFCNKQPRPFAWSNNISRLRDSRKSLRPSVRRCPKPLASA